jgi:hypothetical protein
VIFSILKTGCFGLGSLPPLAYRSSRAAGDGSGFTSGVSGLLCFGWLFRILLIQGCQGVFLDDLDFCRSDGHGDLHGLIQLFCGGTVFSCNCKTVFGSGLTACAKRGTKGDQVFGLDVNGPVGVGNIKKFLVFVETVIHLATSG